MLRKKLRRPIRPLVRTAAVAFLWNNRRDVARWVKFAKRAVSNDTRPAAADLKLEARVRAALSADPLLRSDPSIRDIRVHDGIVVVESPIEWHNRSVAIKRIQQVKGVESVHTAANADEPQWLDVDSIEQPVSSATG